MMITTAGGCGPSDRYYEQQLLQYEREQEEPDDSHEEA